MSFNCREDQAPFTRLWSPLVAVGHLLLSTLDPGLLGGFSSSFLAFIPEEVPGKLPAVTEDPRSHTETGRPTRDMPQVRPKLFIYQLRAHGVVLFLLF